MGIERFNNNEGNMEEENKGGILWVPGSSESFVEDPGKLEELLTGLDILEVVQALNTLELEGAKTTEALVARIYDPKFRELTSIDAPLFTELDEILVRKFSGALAEYCHHENIERVAYMDRRGRSIYPGMDEHWRHAYPDEPRPSAYFLNPLGFRISVPGASQTTLDRHAQKVADQLEAASSPLLKDKDAPLLLMDSCTHSGETLFWTQEMLRRIGFSQVKTGAFIDHRSGFYSILQCDFTVTQEPAVGCSPFGGDLMLEKGADSIFAARPKVSPDDLNAFRSRLRNTIRKVVREGFETSES